MELKDYYPPGTIQPDIQKEAMPDYIPGTKKGGVEMQPETSVIAAPILEEKPIEPVNPRAAVPARKEKKEKPQKAAAKKKK